MARKLIIQVPATEDLRGIVESLIDKDGKEHPDPNKMFIDVHEGTRNSLKEQIERIMNNYYINQAAARSGFETPEEADDFDIPDEAEELRSPYEFEEMIDEELTLDEESSLTPEDKPTKTEPTYSSAEGSEA